MQSSEKMAVISKDSPWGAVAAPFAPVWQTSTRPFLCIRPCHAWGGTVAVERYNTKKHVARDLMEFPGHRR